MTDLFYYRVFLKKSSIDMPITAESGVSILRLASIHFRAWASFFRKTMLPLSSLHL